MKIFETYFQNKTVEIDNFYSDYKTNMSMLTIFMVVFLWFVSILSVVGIFTGIVLFCKEYFRIKPCLNFIWITFSLLMIFTFFSSGALISTIIFKLQYTKFNNNNFFIYSDINRRRTKL